MVQWSCRYNEYIFCASQAESVQQWRNQVSLAKPTRCCHLKGGYDLWRSQWTLPLCCGLNFALEKRCAADLVLTACSNTEPMAENFSFDLIIAIPTN